MARPQIISSTSRCAAVVETSSDGRLPAVGRLKQPEGRRCTKIWAVPHHYRMDLDRDIRPVPPHTARRPPPPKAAKPPTAKESKATKQTRRAARRQAGSARPRSEPRAAGGIRSQTPELEAAAARSQSQTVRLRSPEPSAEYERYLRSFEAEPALQLSSDDEEPRGGATELAAAAHATAAVICAAAGADAVAAVRAKLAAVRVGAAAAAAAGRLFSDLVDGVGVAAAAERVFADLVRLVEAEQAEQAEPAEPAVRRACRDTAEVHAAAAIICATAQVAATAVLRGRAEAAATGMPDTRLASVAEEAIALEVHVHAAEAQSTAAVVCATAHVVAVTALRDNEAWVAADEKAVARAKMQAAKGARVAAAEATAAAVAALAALEEAARVSAEEAASVLAAKQAEEAMRVAAARLAAGEAARVAAEEATAALAKKQAEEAVRVAAEAEAAHVEAEVAAAAFARKQAEEAARLVAEEEEAVRAKAEEVAAAFALELAAVAHAMAAAICASAGADAVAVVRAKKQAEEVARLAAEEEAATALANKQAAEEAQAAVEEDEKAEAVRLAVEAAVSLATEQAEQAAEASRLAVEQAAAMEEARVAAAAEAAEEEAAAARVAAASALAAKQAEEAMRVAAARLAAGEAARVAAEEATAALAKKQAEEAVRVAAEAEAAHVEAEVAAAAFARKQAEEAARLVAEEEEAVRAKAEEVAAAFALELAAVAHAMAAAICASAGADAVAVVRAKKQAEEVARLAAEEEAATALANKQAAEEAQAAVEEDEKAEAVRLAVEAAVSLATEQAEQAAEASRLAVEQAAAMEEARVAAAAEAAEEEAAAARVAAEEEAAKVARKAAKVARVAEKQAAKQKAEEVAAIKAAKVEETRVKTDAMDSKAAAIARATAALASDFGTASLPRPDKDIGKWLRDATVDADDVEDAEDELADRSIETLGDLAKAVASREDLEDLLPNAELVEKAWEEVQRIHASEVVQMDFDSGSESSDGAQADFDSSGSGEDGDFVTLASEEIDDVEAMIAAAEEEAIALVEAEQMPALLGHPSGGDSTPGGLRRVDVAQTGQRKIEDQARIRTALDEVELLENLSSSQRAMVAKTMWVEKFAEGEVIIRQGEKGDRFYVIETGCVSVSQTAATGRDRVLGQLAAGQSFGEIALLCDEPRSATVSAAAGEVTCCVIARRDFKDVLGPLAQIMKFSRYGDKVSETAASEEEEHGGEEADDALLQELDGLGGSDGSSGDSELAGLDMLLADGEEMEEEVEEEDTELAELDMLLQEEEEKMDEDTELVGLDLLLEEEMGEAGKAVANEARTTTQTTAPAPDVELVAVSTAAVICSSATVAAVAAVRAKLSNLRVDGATGQVVSTVKSVQLQEALDTSEDGNLSDVGKDDTEPTAMERATEALGRRRGSFSIASLPRPDKDIGKWLRDATVDADDVEDAEDELADRSIETLGDLAKAVASREDLEDLLPNAELVEKAWEEVQRIHASEKVVVPVVFSAARTTLRDTPATPPPGGQGDAELEVIAEYSDDASAAARSSTLSAGEGAAECAADSSEQVVSADKEVMAAAEYSEIMNRLAESEWGAECAADWACEAARKDALLEGLQTIADDATTAADFLLSELVAAEAKIESMAKHQLPAGLGSEMAAEIRRTQQAVAQAVELAEKQHRAQRMIQKAEHDALNAAVADTAKTLPARFMPLDDVVELMTELEHSCEKLSQQVYSVQDAETASPRGRSGLPEEVSKDVARLSEQALVVCQAVMVSQKAGNQRLAAAAAVLDAERAAELDGRDVGLRGEAAGLFASELAAVSDELMVDLAVAEDQLETETQRRIAAEQAERRCRRELQRLKADTQPWSHDKSKRAFSGPEAVSSWLAKYSRSAAVASIPNLRPLAEFPRGAVLAAAFGPAAFGPEAHGTSDDEHDVGTGGDSSEDSDLAELEMLLAEEQEGEETGIGENSELAPMSPKDTGHVVAAVRKAARRLDIVQPLLQPSWQAAVTRRHEEGTGAGRLLKLSERPRASFVAGPEVVAAWFASPKAQRGSHDAVGRTRDGVVIQHEIRRLFDEPSSAAHVLVEETARARRALSPETLRRTILFEEALAAERNRPAATGNLELAVPEAQSMVEGGDPAPQPDGAPSCWLSAVDPASGCAYWYNTATGDRSWEPPPSASSDSPLAHHQQQQPCSPVVTSPSEACTGGDPTEAEYEYQRGLAHEAGGEDDAAVCSYGRAAENGHVDASLRLARLHTCEAVGRLSPSSRPAVEAAQHGFRHSFDALREEVLAGAAVGGGAAAAALLGDCYRRGPHRGAAPDLAAALGCYCAAALAGHTGAQAEAVMMIQAGRRELAGAVDDGSARDGWAPATPVEAAALGGHVCELLRGIESAADNEAGHGVDLQRGWENVLQETERFLARTSAGVIEYSFESAGLPDTETQLQLWPPPPPVAIKSGESQDQESSSVLDFYSSVLDGTVAALPRSPPGPVTSPSEQGETMEPVGCMRADLLAEKAIVDEEAVGLSDGQTTEDEDTDDSGSDDVLAGAGAPPPPVDRLLEAAGWATNWSSTHSRYYWWNRLSKETQWLQPALPSGHGE